MSGIGLEAARAITEEVVTLVRSVAARAQVRNAASGRSSI
jgi:hypothetical protein